MRRPCPVCRPPAFLSRKAEPVCPSCKARVQRILAKIRSLGATVVTIEENEGNCPFSGHVGVDYRPKVVHFDYVYTDSVVSELIHEAAHVLATLDSPEDCNEYLFLGWEFALAIELDVLPELLAGHWDYTISSNPGEMSFELGLLEEDELTELIEERLDFARLTGLIDADDRVRVLR